MSFYIPSDEDSLPVIVVSGGINDDGSFSAMPGLNRKQRRERVQDPKKPIQASRPVKGLLTKFWSQHGPK